MIDIFELYQQFNGSVNSHQGGFVPPRIFTEWVQEINILAYNERIEEFQKTQQKSDQITPFLDSINVVVSNVAGATWDLVAKPQNLKNGTPYPYENYGSARIIKINGESVGCKGLKEFCDGKEVTGSGKIKRYVDPDELEKTILDAGKNNCEIGIELVDNNRWGAICTHPRKKLTCANPKMTQYSGGFKISPKGCATSIIMDFFRMPVKPVYNFIVINPQQENEYFQYVAAGSVHLEWSPQLIPYFISKLMDKFATFVGDNAMWNQAKANQKQIES